MDLRDKVAGIWDENIPIVRQWVLEGVGIHQDILNDEEKLARGADLLCEKLGLTVVDRNIKRFEPQGLTLVYMLSESHIAMHSWPERRYLHVDLVTCKKTKIDIGEVCDIFDEHFGPSHARAFSVKY